MPRTRGSLVGSVAGTLAGIFAVAGLAIAIAGPCAAQSAPSGFEAATPLLAPTFDTDTSKKVSPAKKPSGKPNPSKRAAGADAITSDPADPYGKARKAQQDYFRQQKEKRDAAVRAYDPNAYSANRPNNNLNFFGGGGNSGANTWQNPTR